MYICCRYTSINIVCLNIELILDEKYHIKEGLDYSDAFFARAKFRADTKN